MNIYKLISAIFLIAWGIWCLVAAIKGKRAQALVFKNDSFLLKSILGKYYDLFINLFIAVVGIVGGLFLVIEQLTPNE